MNTGNLDNHVFLGGQGTGNPCDDHNLLTADKDDDHKVDNKNDYNDSMIALYNNQMGASSFSGENVGEEGWLESMMRRRMGGLGRGEKENNEKMMNK